MFGKDGPLNTVRTLSRSLLKAWGLNSRPCRIYPPYNRDGREMNFERLFCTNKGHVEVSRRRAVSAFHDTATENPCERFNVQCLPLCHLSRSGGSLCKTDPFVHLRVMIKSRTREIPNGIWRFKIRPRISTTWLGLHVLQESEFRRDRGMSVSWGDEYILLPSATV